MRAQCQELDRPSRDLVVMGFLMALQDVRESLDYDVSHRNSKERESFRGSYHHAGYKVLHVIFATAIVTSEKVCRKTFLFLHSIGVNQFKLIKKSYLQNGLTPR